MGSTDWFNRVLQQVPGLDSAVFTRRANTFPIGGWVETL